MARIKAYLWIDAGCGESGMGLDHDLIFISVAARMLGMHPQTLRKYERLGLIQPSRTIGSMRLYSREELERVKLIKRLVDDGGINLAGVQRLLSIAEVVQRLRPMMRDEALSARDGRRRLAHELDELSRMLGFD
jgi:MerR family transcriptional regulator, heat shock protein HspR